MGKKLSIDAINLAYKILRATGLFNAVNSKFFKRKKPVNFKGECVVFNALPMTTDQLQQCRVMVNIYVPNDKIKLDGKEDSSQANDPRLKELSEFMEVFNDYDADGYSFRIEQEYVIENEGFNEHYNNFRLIFRNENI